MKHYLFYLFLILLSDISMFSQEKVTSGIKWYEINEAFELNKKEPRPVFIFVNTDWCSWCKFMLKTTLTNSGIANYINTYFYAVKFNAETTDTIEFNGTKYFNRRVGRQPVHDLATKLLEGNFTYPSIVYFDRDGNKSVFPGYKEVKDLEPFLIYYAENVYRTATIDEFILNYMYTFPQAFQSDHSIYKIDRKLKPDTLGIVNWVSPDQIQILQKKKPKPILLYYYTDWSISSKVMERTSFGNRELSGFLTDKFYAVKLNAASQDNINFLGKIYPSTGINQPNQITLDFLNGNNLMPAIAIFDEKNTRLSSMNGYLNTNQIILLSNFYFNKIYKKMSFQNYIKSQNSQVKLGESANIN